MFVSFLLRHGDSMKLASRSILIVGVVVSGLYTAFYIATCLSYYFYGNWDAQITAAFISAPTSALFFNICDPVLNTLGELGSPRRQAVEWVILLLSGWVQFFLIGATLALLMFGPRKAN